MRKLFDVKLDETDPKERRTEFEVCADYENQPETTAPTSCLQQTKTITKKVANGCGASIVSAVSSPLQTLCCVHSLIKQKTALNKEEPDARECSPKGDACFSYFMFQVCCCPTLAGITKAAVIGYRHNLITGVKAGTHAGSLLFLQGKEVFTDTLFHDPKYDAPVAQVMRTFT